MKISDVMSKVMGMKREDKIKSAVIAVVVLIAVYLAFNFVVSLVNRDKIFASGTIEAVETDVATKVPGRVTSFLADEGDTVRKGTVIASLETSELYANLKQTIALESSAQIRY